MYYEEYLRIDEAFYREKQVQGWSRKKKEALINGTPQLLSQLAVAYRDLKSSGGFEKDFNCGFESLNHKGDTVSSSASDTEVSSASDTEVLRTSDTRAISLPGVLEGSEREALEDTVNPSKNEYK